MGTADIIVLAIIPMSMLFLCYLYLRKSFEDIPLFDQTIRKYSTMITFPIGRMDERTKHSVYHWVFGIYVRAYEKGRFEKAIDIVQLWSHEQNDTTNCIHAGCDLALQRVMARLEEIAEEAKHNIAEENKKKLTCNPHFNYHEVPKTLQYNDYVDPETLVSAIDRLLED